MLDFFKNTFLNRGRYKTHAEAVVIAAYYNPRNNPYRLLAFRKWYKSVRHLNHRVVECVIGDARPQLPASKNISVIRSDALLWHKEAILNRIVRDLPLKYRYVFWVDADLIFTNHNWLPEAVQVLKTENICQPFEYAIHLEKGDAKPGFDVTYAKQFASSDFRNPRLWRSFASNHPGLAASTNYDRHGHVGFAWGARREVLEQCPLFDHALVGGADHVIAHAAAGHIPHECITRAFADNIDEINDWSRKFYGVVRGRIGFVRGEVHHLWHGDIKSRQYFKRIKEFTNENKQINRRDANGLYAGKSRYVENYYAGREDVGFNVEDLPVEELADFAADMGYAIADLLSRPKYAEPEPPAFDTTPVPQEEEPCEDGVLPPPAFDTTPVPQEEEPCEDGVLPESENFS